MGLDYIRAQTGKPWRKRWNGGLDRLKTPTLLDITESEAAHFHWWCEGAVASSRACAATSHASA